MRLAWLAVAGIAGACSAVPNPNAPLLLAVRSLDEIRVTNETADAWTACHARLAGGYLLNHRFDLGPRTTVTLPYESFVANDAPVMLTKRDGYVRAGNGIAIECVGDDGQRYPARLQ